MNGRSLAVVVLAAAVVLAGCQALPGGDGQATPEPTGTAAPSPSSGSTPTATPSPTPTATPSLSELDVPPGISESGVADGDALLSAHGNALDGQSATVDVQFLLTVDGTGRNVSFRGKTVPGSDRGWIQVRNDQGVGTYYTAGGTTYEKVTVGGETSYGTTDDVSALPEKPRFGTDARIRAAIVSANWTTTGVTVRDGVALFRLEATDVRPPNVDDPDATVTSSGELLVDERGVVHHVSVHTRVESADGTVEYGLEVTLSDVGSTTVEEPDWLDEARGG